MLSARFGERLAGTYHLTGGKAAGELMVLTLSAEVGSLVSFLRKRELRVSGTMDARGLCTSQPVEGIVAFGRRPAHMDYALSFLSDAGKRFKFSGRRELVPGASLESATILAAELSDEQGECAGTALLRFDLRSDLIPFMRSFRFSI